MEIVDCNCCGSSNLRKVYEKPDDKYFPEEWFTVVECLECGLGFVNPRPTTQEIGRYYPVAFFSDFEEKDHSQRYAEEARYLADIEYQKKIPRLLDLGCANGDFPRYMRSRGWDVTGLEIAESSKSIEDFPVYRELFPCAPIPAHSFDAITAWAVIEHVHDPMAYFKKAAEVLKPGGHFVFLVTNFESLASRHLFCEDIPRHLYFFTPSTIRYYLKQVGMTLQQIDFDDRIFSLHSKFWLLWLLRLLTGRTLQYKDLPPTYRQEVPKKGWRLGLLSKIRYALGHPIVSLDQALRPIVDWYAIRQKRYGTIICVAEKPGAGHLS